MRRALKAVVVVVGCSQPAPRAVPISNQNAPAPTVKACAAVSMGLDLRALPRGSTIEDIDLFVRGEAWEMAGTQVANSPRVYTMSGVGAFDVAFDDQSSGEAHARCHAAVAAYLPKAPTNAGSTESAASVTTPCRDCPPEQR
jgi:hypothetical protein